MSENSSSKPFLVKLLAILGFSATILLIGWALLMVLTKGQATFSSLADRAEQLDITNGNFELKSDKAVVNSDETFTISWTDMKENGNYTFSYVCTEEVTASAQTADEAMENVECEKPFTISSDTMELALKMHSTGMRFSEVPLQVTFESTDGKVKAEDEFKVTILNISAKPANETLAEPAKPATTPVTVQPSQPVYSVPTISYPQSDPYGYTDLKIITLGSGVVNRGVFAFTQDYEENDINAVMIDIENIGTKTSDGWTFTTSLPNGQRYSSPMQYPLKPREHAVFTIHFAIDDEDDTEIESTVYTTRDVQNSNNWTVWDVDVR